MSKRSAAIVALVSFWGCLCVTGCSRTGPVWSEPTAKNIFADTERVSKSMPEVEIISVSGETWKTARLISLDVNVLKFRVYPIRSWELTRIRVEEIAEIKQMKKKRGAMIGALAGMTPGIAAFVGYSANSHPHDRPGILIFSSLIAAAGAIVGLLAGLITDASRKTPYDLYDFRTISEAEKISVLRKIMKI